MLLNWRINNSQFGVFLATRALGPSLASLLVVIIANAVIGYYQEANAADALAKIKDLLATNATVYRVFSPVATTTPKPEPLTTVVEEKAMFACSAKGKSAVFKAEADKIMSKRTLYRAFQPKLQLKD